MFSPLLVTIQPAYWLCTYTNNPCYCCVVSTPDCFRHVCFVWTCLCPPPQLIPPYNSCVYYHYYPYIYIYAYISPHNVMMNFIEFRIFWMIWDDYPKWLTFSSLRWSTRQRLHVSKLKSNNTSKSSSGRVPRFPWRLRAQWTLLQLATCVYV